MSMAKRIEVCKPHGGCHNPMDKCSERDHWVRPLPSRGPISHNNNLDLTIASQKAKLTEQKFKSDHCHAEGR
ncbi:hypothetical protein LR48_Vigan03g174700 [Vigna angularis]|uniref:Uncharacterized protein n=1 Tax=Phaseolus angularis TaxID=3914 RepID=A0A0L9U6E7_PHAAN|nr:hypothetical protein LR48_Vigan03g174700 [Vigna angularis]